MEGQYDRRTMPVSVPRLALLIPECTASLQKSGLLEAKERICVECSFLTKDFRKRQQCLASYWNPQRPGIGRVDPIVHFFQLSFHRTSKFTREGRIENCRGEGGGERRERRRDDKSFVPSTPRTVCRGGGAELPPCLHGELSPAGAPSPPLPPSPVAIVRHIFFV